MYINTVFPSGSDDKESAYSAGDPASMHQEDSLRKGMIAHANNLAWEVPWAEEPGGPNTWGLKESGMTE